MSKYSIRACGETIEKPRSTARMRFAPRAKKPLSVHEKKLRGRTFKYLSLWDGIYNKWGWADKSKAEKEELRHSINVDLFGRYTPPSRLTNEQFSVMRYALELLYNEGILVWSAEMAELAREEGLRRVYAWWIEHAGLDVEGIEEYRKNRMIMGYFRYGSLQSQIGRAKYDNVGSIESRLSIYKSDHNREHLVDIANLAMIEFATHPDYPFRPSDDGVHAAKKSEKIVRRDLTSFGCRAWVLNGRMEVSDSPRAAYFTDVSASSGA